MKPMTTYKLTKWSLNNYKCTYCIWIPLYRMLYPFFLTIIGLLMDFKKFTSSSMSNYDPYVTVVKMKTWVPWHLSWHSRLQFCLSQLWRKNREIFRCYKELMWLCYKVRPQEKSLVYSRNFNFWLLCIDGYF